MSKSMYNLKDAFDDLNSLLNTKSIGNEKKKRGRPPKKEKSIIVKELQRALQKILKILEDELSRPNLFYDTNTTTYQQVISDLGYLLHEYKDTKDVAKKSTEVLSHIALIVINSGLLENGQDDDDWVKIVLESLSLIEIFVQQDDTDRQTLGKLCLKILSQALLKQPFPIDVRRMAANLINALLTGCKENKKLLSQEQFFKISDLASSMISALDYELQLRHLEILFRLCPRVQKDREIFANKAFMDQAVVTKFLDITANEFFEDSRYFLNEINANNDGVSKTPKTFKVSRMKYNQCELYSPEGQRYFFVDFNKWTISMTISTMIPTKDDESADIDVIDIKYSKISSWDFQCNSNQILKLYLSEPLKLGQDHSVNEPVINMIFDPVESRIKESIERIFNNQKVKSRTQQPKVSVSIGILQPHSSSFNTATALDTLSKSLEASKTPTSERIDKHINIPKDTDLDEDATLVNVDESQNNTSTFSNILAKSRSQLPKNITPPPLPMSSSSNENSPCNNINSMNCKPVTQILENNYNVNHRYAFPPPKQRTRPLNLSASKQKNKINNNVDLVAENDCEIITNNARLNNECSSPSAARSCQNVSTINNIQKRTDQPRYGKNDLVKRLPEFRNDTKKSNGEDLEKAQNKSNVAKNYDPASVKNDKRLGLPHTNENRNHNSLIDYKGGATRKNLFNNVAYKNNNVSDENPEIGHGRSKRKTLDLNDDDPEVPKQYRNDDQIKGNSNYRVVTKQGGKKLIVVDDDESQIMSEEEFWNPKQKNNYDSSTDIEYVDVTDRQCLKSKHHKGENRHVSFIKRLQAFTNYLGADEDKDDEETSMQDDIYIIHSRDSSPTINDNDEAVQKNINEIETNKEHYETIDDGTDNEDNFIPSKVVNEKIKPRKFADGQWDEEIRSLLQLVGEAIFRQFQRQDSTLFQSSENAIIQSETKLTQSLEKQFERKRELLNTYRNNYTLIATESQQMMNKLKEGRNDLETLEHTLIDMEKMELEFGINIECNL
ncbi:synaptonemal complex protein 2-like isoform x2 [Gigaspora margarita]|uniref:Synaptonemal complex protein 2-like isoform x2 n=1 Tax=Gigaspora margarita TaxID=4874 RepID=A0A8H4AME1_GIGMA|nr:synaptonemal complex protein 2-like isoform x2 [Gigaspora margarita]